MKTIISALAALLITAFGVSALAVDPLNIGVIRGNTVKLNVPINKLDTIQGHFVQQDRTLYRIDDTTCREGRVILELSPTELTGRVSSATILKSFNSVKLPYKKKLVCNPWSQ